MIVIVTSSMNTNICLYPSVILMGMDISQSLNGLAILDFNIYAYDSAHYCFVTVRTINSIMSSATLDKGIEKSS